ncbi:MAG: ABC transporter ATP-binding protein [Phycisphaera sp.]|nr:MAG: ABC transporter ATP-binding protein [Phycisphaera sp.]
MIEVRGITKKFGSLVAVDDVSLTVGPGEVYGFIGPNGAGKSTTMKVLACLLKPDSGSAFVDGMDVTVEGDSIRRILGYMPDVLGVYDDLTVEEYLHFFAAAFKIPRKSRKGTIEGVLELTDLTEKKKAMVDSLSRGMKQRLGVARVLVHDPKVLLLDEPASGLDPRARIEMRELLTELARMGKSLIVSSHILSELGQMSTSIGIIERGKLLYSGSIEDAYAKMGVGDRVKIRLEDAGDSLSQVRNSLVADKRISRAEVEGETIDVEFAPGQKSHHFLIEMLIAKGVHIASFTPETPRLEDAFMTLTKGQVQ